MRGTTWNLIDIVLLEFLGVLHSLFISLKPCKHIFLCRDCTNVFIFHFSGGKQRTSVPWKPFSSSGKTAAANRILGLCMDARSRQDPEVCRMTPFWTSITSKMREMWRRACQLFRKLHVHQSRPFHLLLSSRRAPPPSWQMSSSTRLLPM